VTIPPPSSSGAVLLQMKDHRVGIEDFFPYIGDVEGIMIEPRTGVLFGASDPRNPNAMAIGY